MLLVSLVTPSYLSCSGKESLRLPDWSKLLTLLILLLVGSPTVSSAHDCHHEQAKLDNPVAQNPEADATAAANPNKQPQFVENTHQRTDGKCTVLCCCEGMTHCGSSGGSISTLNGDVVTSAYDARAPRLPPAGNQAIPDLQLSSGLERPPKA
jgi:hypothetical protein